MQLQRQRRSGFTIVEMLVATALILFIMAIISTVFSSASKVFTDLKVAGDLQQNLRTATVILRKDLAAEHFAGPFIPGRSGPRLGDQRLDLPGWVPPSGGYFEIRQVGEGNNVIVPVLYEPGPNPLPPNVGNSIARNDGELLWSTRATSHFVRFTVNLGDVSASEMFCAEAPPIVCNLPATTAFPNTGFNVCYSKWAEVTYFLWSNNDSTTASAGGQSLPLYSLRRRVRLLAPKTIVVDGLGPSKKVQIDEYLSRFPGIALQPYQMVPNQDKFGVKMLGPEAVTIPGNRLSYMIPQAEQKSNVYTGEDILLTDVLSFEVKAAWFNSQSFNSVAPGSSPASVTLPGNADDPFDNIPIPTLNPQSGHRLFDTHYKFADLDWDKASPQNNGFLAPFPLVQNQVPLRINVRALQIKIRVYDRKAEKTRQVTIIQEM